MKEQPVPERLQISPFLVFYLVMSMQIGIGVLGYQRIIAMDAGYDAWISILFAGGCIHVIVWMIYKIGETVGGDIVTAHKYILGNFFGKALCSIFIGYFILYSLTVVRTFVEVIQVWMFPELSTFWFSFGFMILCVYIIFGGFRTVVGTAFFGLVLPAYLLLTFGWAIKFSNFYNLLPIWDHSIKELLTASYHMSLTFIGFEIILFFYPFIKEPKKSQKWAHLAVLTTTLIYTILAIITFAYFAEDQLSKQIWASLTMWKIVEMPFVERFEYIGIANWNLIILPNVCISIWIASRLIKRVFNIRQKVGVFFVVGGVLSVIHFLDSRERINTLNDYVGKMGFTFTFIYIPLLFAAVMFVKKLKKGKKK
ncbi:spore germination protein (amino acid permease) [Cytobacillus firmus]|uniref:Spore germination protein (Amino acid permease) n=2 Tax=Cytobacillus TaxID=2675230 RepID=A0A366JRZ3_CYTFI|nr:MULTISPECIES: GerAB/ArcD/ProY family transporter [Cytobacillus]RBP91340.1 spore germination protein (amino acid permease) [Cytobacillus firmus]TDX41540.1 spore germination protein (amino acid permease) [Cytobacillus oceanisediminis]